MSQTGRTKQKIRENLELLKDFLAKKYGQPVDSDTEQILFNALDWTADDVESQWAGKSGEVENGASK